MVDMTGKRWNQLINAVNENVSKDKIEPALNDKESKVYDDMKRQLDGVRAKWGPGEKFAPVEIESNDPVLDIYNE